MNWSVPVKNDGTAMSDGDWDKLTLFQDFNYWDMHCERIRYPHMKQNYRVWLRHGKESMLLGETNMTGRLGTAWAAYGWAGGTFFDVRGFATRRYAIVYMLSQHGFGNNW